MNDFKLHDMSTWSGALVLGFSVAIFASYDVVNWALMRATATTTKLPINTGKHLDTLDRTDYVFITINRLTGVPFVFHCIQWASTSSSMLWHPSELSVSNTLGSLLCLFVFYDFFYCLWHRLLHVRSIYGLIHKHHHRQVVPTRGLYDAMNVHPVEFLVGEYLHLIAMMVIPAHIITYTTFFALLGILAGLNHSRNDIHMPPIYSVRWHDYHHRVPQCNYGQYTMIWDAMCGSFRNAVVSKSG